ncbi:hypothetical protein Clacol_003583 [Clathrus columnatus]|uniref:Uncharacterized protein n=1 Tax=Clathrus columnatus TaxID=1419009 RepID=A0AAV5A3Y2_9AGAM|nr:hypothetical protein Clacol_003583 [Clathrus columnatus]
MSSNTVQAVNPKERLSFIVSDPSFRTRETRLRFPPFYAVVGVYRLASDPSLYKPIWDKVRHGTQRGLTVGLVWIASSPKVTGLSHDKIFGYNIPFDIVTYATVMFISSQFNMVLKFFLSKNLRIARDRAWDQTLKSRGKGTDFWGPYVEEWQSPPHITSADHGWEKWVSSAIFRIFVRKVLLAPLNLYPFIGVVISSLLKAFGMARYLHQPYFKAKKMSDNEVALFMEERKWDYRGQSDNGHDNTHANLPYISKPLAFSISNRIGAAMWAHDLEKRQHLYASGELLPRPPA